MATIVENLNKTLEYISDVRDSITRQGIYVDKNSGLKNLPSILNSVVSTREIFYNEDTAISNEKEVPDNCGTTAYLRYIEGNTKYFRSEDVAPKHAILRTYETIISEKNSEVMTRKVLHLGTSSKRTEIKLSFGGVIDLLEGTLVYYKPKQMYHTGWKYNQSDNFFYRPLPADINKNFVNNFTSTIYPKLSQEETGKGYWIKNDIVFLRDEDLTLQGLEDLLYDDFIFAYVTTEKETYVNEKEQTLDYYNLRNSVREDINPFIRVAAKGTIKINTSTINEVQVCPRIKYTIQEK